MNLRMERTRFVTTSTRRARLRIAVGILTVLLYSAANGVVYGTIYEGGKATLIGAPPPAVAAELEKLWKTEWRQQR